MIYCGASGVCAFGFFRPLAALSFRLRSRALKWQRTPYVKSRGELGIGHDLVYLALSILARLNAKYPTVGELSYLEDSEKDLDSVVQAMQTRSLTKVPFSITTRFRDYWFAARRRGSVKAFP
jgi:hypothetical protein